MDRNLVGSSPSPPSYKDTVHNANDNAGERKLVDELQADEIIIDNEVLSNRVEVTHHIPIRDEFPSHRPTTNKGWLSSLGVKILIALLCVIIVFVVTFLMLVIKERDEARRLLQDV